MCRRVQILIEVLHATLSPCVRDDNLNVDLKSEDNMPDAVIRVMMGFILNS